MRFDSMNQKALFTDAKPGHLGDCEFSQCGKYRYTLWRRWADGPSYVQFIGLNPSTASETEDDPTMRRLRGFAEREGFPAFCMTNLFAYRATDPKAMMAALFPVGVCNNDWIVRVSRSADKIVCCWGSHGTHRGQYEWVLRSLANRHLWCFGKTKNGQPKHPLYLKADTPLIRY